MNRHFTVKNGQVFIVCEAPGGVYNGDQLRQVCNLADEHSAFLKIVESQRLGFLVDEENLPMLTKALRDVGLQLQHYRCPGAPTTKACLGELCPHSKQDSLSDSIELANRLTERFPDPRTWVMIGINGCEEGCASTALDDLHIIGEETGYKIAIGGRSREFPQVGSFLTDNISREMLPVVMEQVLQVFYTHQEANERISDVIERLGVGIFLQVLEDLPSSGGDAGLIDVDQALASTTDFDETPVEALETSLDDTNILSEDIDDLENIEDISANSGEPELGDTLDLVDDVDLGISPEPSLEEDFPIDDASELDEDLSLETFEEKPIVDTDANLLEEEVDIAVPRLCMRVEPTSSEFTETTDLELEEATIEDLERVTATLREEMAMNPSEAAEAAEEEQPLLPPIAHPQSAATTQAPAAPGGKFKIRMGMGCMDLMLPGDIEFSLPFDSIPEQGALEVELEGQTLSVERTGGLLVLKYGAMSMTIPDLLRRSAA